MPTRRLVLAGAAAALAFRMPAPAAAVPAGDRLDFSVFRKKASPMGSHRLRFTRDGDRLIMEKEIRLEVRLAFITAYRYRHVNREVWQQGRLVEIDTRTDDDGEEYQVYGRANPEGFQVEGSRGRFTAPADIIPTSYWNIATIGATRLLDTQRGLVMDVRIDNHGKTDVETADGSLMARHHSINILSNPPGSTDRIDLWYDINDRWVALGFEAKGQNIHYILDSADGGTPAADRS
ncbi:DUF6134 family protein [Niveispirillum fermenti]|uniref:DUF6134 family protein n=1 Tax=Niveispirillum fermenti TaxID=1233113 RepID=UPI003A86BA7B